MKWEVMDVCDMKQLEANTFDLVVDKSTIDALLCGDNSFINVAKMINEIQDENNEYITREDQHNFKKKKDLTHIIFHVYFVYIFFYKNN